MKKDSLERKAYRKRRARNQLKRGPYRGRYVRDIRVPTHVILYYGAETFKGRLAYEATHITPPSALCFFESPLETAKFFDEIRDCLLANDNPDWFSEPLTQDNEPVLDTVFALENLEEITTSAALILAAEYQRKSLTNRNYPPFVNLHKWSPQVVNRLNQLGFFETLSIPTVPNSAQEDDNVKTIKLYSGHDASNMQVSDENLLTLIDHIDPDYDFGVDHPIRHALNNALGEAIINVRGHAYKPDHEFQYPHFNRWWATGAAERSTRSIVVTLYDQGISIPITYPKLDFFAELISKGKFIFGGDNDNEYQDDARLIQAATKYGNSGTDVLGRGNGLPSMKRAVQVCGGGALLIASRGGLYKYSLKGGVPLESLKCLNCSVGGTLVEWRISLPDV